MRDTYPHSLDKLVEPEAQPDYVAPATRDFPASANIGIEVSDRQVDLGRGASVAVIDARDGRQWTFNDLAIESSRIAEALCRFGIVPGDRVAYRSPNAGDVLSVMIGIWKAGAVVVPIPIQATPKDIRFYIEDSAARLLFLHPRAGESGPMLEAVANTSVEEILCFGPRGDAVAGLRHIDDLGGRDAFEPPRLAENSIGILWHTGGTTGTPKGCYHTHRRFLLGGLAIGEQTDVKPGERWIAATPIGHALGIIYDTIYTLLHGASVVMLEDFSDPARLLKAIETYQIDTVTALMPSWSKMLAEIEADATLPVPQLKRAYAMWQSASAAGLYERWKNKGVVLLNNFGSTSFATWVAAPLHSQPSPRASLGKPIPGYEIEAVAVVDGEIQVLPRGEIGQMAVRGPTGLTYWGLPEMQARDVVQGWTLQDDLIQYDEEGFIHYLGRTDYMISTGGFKVAPVEVEEALARHPDVQEVAVVPGPCPVNREMVVAFVVLRPSATGDERLVGELRACVKRTLPSYKAPKRIEFVETLPRDPVGKVQTKIVKQWAFAD